MPLSPRVRFALVAGGAAAIAGGGVWLWTTLRPKPSLPDAPALLCPRHVGKAAAPSASVEPGDFVVVELQSPDGKFHESTWATVAAVAGNALVVILTGEQIPEGIRPLRTKQHGFRLGHKMILERDCIWEVFRPAEMTGQILCGPQILELAKFLEDDTLFPVASGLTVQQGDRAKIMVGSIESFGNAWNESLWTRIVTISPSGQVVTAKIQDEPELTERHGLVEGSIVRYNRDCVIGV